MQGQTDKDSADGGLTRALAAHYYNDRDIFRAEQERIFYRTWNFACHQSQLEKPGDYVTFHIGDQSLFTMRGRDGQLRSFYNVCMHRAHELLKGSGHTKIITCPYHAWSYGLDGKFRRAPNQEKVTGFDGSKICLTEVRTELFCGFVFVNLDPEARSMTEWYPGAEEEMRSFLPNLERLKPIHWVEIEEACNWKVSVENYSECYHCGYAHPTFASGVIDAKCYDIRAQGHCLRHQTVAADLSAMTYDIDTSQPHATDYSSWFLWPSVSFQVYPGNRLNSYHWEVTSSESVTVRRGWYNEDGAASDLVAGLAEQDRATTMAEDIVLVEAVQRGLRNRGYRPGPLIIDPDFGVMSEHSVKSLKDWYLEAMDGVGFATAAT